MASSWAKEPTPVRDRTREVENPDPTDSFAANVRPVFATERQGRHRVLDAEIA
jgi:hypothetical protein